MFMSRTVNRRGRLPEERGTALVELAIVLPLLMVLLLGMLDFGKAYNSWIDETHLANLGVRLAAVNYLPPGGWPASCAGDPTGGLGCYIRQKADLPELTTGRSSDSYAPAQSASQVCVSFPNVGHASPLVGDPVQVTVSTDYHWLRYLTARLSLGTTTIRGKATMRLEGVPSHFSAGCYS